MKTLPRGSNPSVISFDVTYRCNLQCRMCNTWRLPDGREEMTAEQIIKTAFDYGAALGITSVRFLGGEPLLRDDVPDIVAAVSPTFATELVTNGTLMTPRLAERLVRSGLHNLRVSIDGPEDVNDRMRGAGSFQKSARALDMIREAKERLGADHPAVTVWQCTSRLNCGALCDMYLFAKSKGAAFAIFFMVDGPAAIVGDALWDAPRGIRRLVDPDHLCLTLQERRRVTLDYFRMLATVEDRGAIGIAMTRLAGHARVWHSRLGSIIYRDCSRSMHAIIVDPYGDLVPCEHLYTYRYGNCLTDGPNAWGSQTHIQLRRAIRSGSISPCRECNRFSQYRSRHDYRAAPSRVLVRGR